MKQPSILDVIQGVKRVASAHPEVDVWWYAPPVRLRLGGELPRTAGAASSIEVVVEGSGVVCARIAQDLSLALADADVTVRIYRGDAEERQLFRVMSRDVRRRHLPAPRPA
jgi:hypothetical protein